MDLDNIAVMTLMKRRMQWLSQNQKVISGNIANADTPHYSAQELEPFDFKREMRSTQRLQPTVTSVAHLHGESGSSTRVSTLDDRAPYETSPTGNSVILEQQMIKMQGNEADYQMALNLYKKTTDLFRTALRGH
jgi:flagellar basal-body rod protein FlgB